MLQQAADLLAEMAALPALLGLLVPFNQADFPHTLMFKVGTAGVVALQLETPMVATARQVLLAARHLVLLVAAQLVELEVETTLAH